MIFGHAMLSFYFMAADTAARRMPVTRAPPCAIVFTYYYMMLIGDIAITKDEGARYRMLRALCEVSPAFAASHGPHAVPWPRPFCAGPPISPAILLPPFSFGLLDTHAAAYVVFRGFDVRERRPGGRRGFQLVSYIKMA